MKAVLLGGPLHGTIRWLEGCDEANGVAHQDGWYRFAFGDEHVAILYWNLNLYHRKAIANQITQLRVRHGELGSEPVIRNQ